MQIVKRIFPYFLTALLGVFAFFRSDGFVVTKLSSDLVYQDQWDLPLPDVDILQVLDQKFTYLASGRQCFVFESEDHQVVIKFLNHARFYMHPLLKNVPLPESLHTMRMRKIQKRHARIQDFMNSFMIGCKKLKQESGILFAQLKPSGMFQKPLHIFDVSHHEHLIDLNCVNFIVQRKVDQMIYPYLDSLEKGAFCEALDRILMLVAGRIHKGIMDDDLNVEVNIGFLHQEPIMIDVGRLCVDPNLQFSKELEKSTRFLHRWLEKSHPEMVDYFVKKRDNLSKNRSISKRRQLDSA